MKERISKAIPYPLKQTVKWLSGFLPTEMRYGTDFFRISEELQESERWPLGRLEEYQNRRLTALISHAYQHVPYYHSLFNKHGIMPRDIKTTHDLKKIPTLSKEDLRNNFENLTATNMRKKDLVFLSTSGTAGRPVHLYAEKKHKRYLDGSPSRWRNLKWGGCTPRDIRGTLSVYKIPLKKNGQRRLYSFDPMRRLLMLSTYDMNRNNIHQYAFALHRYKPQFLHGFPSALEMIVKYLKDEGISAPIYPKAIFTQSEVVYPWQRQLIEEYFCSEIYDWYGMEERVVAASECEMHSGYHVFSEYCVAEVLREEKNVIGMEGEIVSTPLDNYAMPLIRYKTGDFGVLLSEKCACGRSLPLMKLAGGRDRNFVVAKSGSLISITVVDIPNATKNIEQFQFVQNEVGVLTLNVQRKDSFSGEDLDLIRNDLQEKFGNLIAVRIKFVERIERTARGKLPLLIQNLNLDKDGYPGYPS